MPSISLEAETVIAIFTVVLAFSTILLWWETRRLARGAKEQAADFLRSVEASERAAAAAQKGADVAERALVGVQRPVLILDIVDFNEAVPPPREPAASHEVRVQIRLENAGVLTAYLDSFVVEVRPVHRAQQDDLKPPIPSSDELGGIHAVDLLEHRTVVRPNQKFGFSHVGFVDMSADVLPDYWGLGQRRLIFFGLVTYSDPMGIKRELGFTYLYSPLAKERRWTPLDDMPDQSFDRIVA
jgi:hypothetical protein